MLLVSALRESVSVSLILVFLSLELVARSLLTGFYYLFPWRGLLGRLYGRLRVLRAVFSANFRGPTEPQLRADFRALVAQHPGFAVEEHFAATPDGFTLVLHRVRRCRPRDVAAGPTPAAAPLPHREPLLLRENTSPDDVRQALGRVFASHPDPWPSWSSPPSSAELQNPPHADCAPRAAHLMHEAHGAGADRTGGEAPLAPTSQESAETAPDSDVELGSGALLLDYPVLLMHGMAMSSECFVFERELSLALRLAELGCDVWVGNNRGNKYSWRHRRHGRESGRYWDFSIDELASCDVPTLVKHVLLTTGRSDLAYIGFSNGSAQMFAALAANVDNLRSKVRAFVALSPACKLRQINPGFGLLFPLISSHPAVLHLLFGRRSFLGVTLVWQRILSAGLFTRAMDAALYILFGWRLRRATAETKQRFYAHLFSTTSVRVVRHWFQMLRSGRFERFAKEHPGLGAAADAGAAEYRIEDIETPVVLVYGGRDSFSDVHWLTARLRNCEKCCIEHYEHLDPLAARDAPVLVHLVVESVLRYHVRRAPHPVCWGKLP